MLPFASRSTDRKPRRGVFSILRKMEQLHCRRIARVRLTTLVGEDYTNGGEDYTNGGEDYTNESWDRAGTGPGRVCRMELQDGGSLRGLSRSKPFCKTSRDAGEGETSLGCPARLLHHQIDRHNGAGGGGQIGRQR